MCVRVCVCVCVRVCVCVYNLRERPLIAWPPTCMFVCVCACICMYVYIHTCLYTRGFMYMDKIAEKAADGL